MSTQIFAPNNPPAFRGPQVVLRDAVEFIAAKLYPSEGKRSACDRVRKAFRYAQKTGKLPGTDSFELSALLRWIHKQWPEFRTVAPEVNALYCKAGIRPALQAKAGIRFVLRPIPKDHEELLKFAREGEYERQVMREKIVRLRWELRAANRQIAEMKKKNREIHAKAVEAGKQGGRGKSK